MTCTLRCDRNRMQERATKAREHSIAFLFALLTVTGGAVVATAGSAAPSVPAPAASGEDLLSALTFTPQHGPVTISAEELEFDYQTRELVYRGGVTVRQADLTLGAERLRMTLDDAAAGQVRKVVADGTVRITQGGRVATGDHATFDRAHETVVLRGHAVLQDGTNRVAGDRVVVYLREQRSVVEGGRGRVRAVLYPRDGAAPAGAGEVGLGTGSANGS